MAPELFLDLDQNDMAIYDQRVDVYALGVMMDLSWKTFVNEGMSKSLEDLIIKMKYWD